MKCTHHSTTGSARGWAWSLFLMGLLSPLPIHAQQTLSLDHCLDLVEINHPLGRQTSLVAEQAELEVQAMEKDRLPSLDLNGQASYQSDVTHLTGPAKSLGIEPPHKDQYRATLDATQLIYQGGRVEASVKVRENRAAMVRQQLEVSLYGLKARVNHLYFSILLLQENQDLLEAKRSQLNTHLAEVRAGVAYGTLLPTSADALEVELIKIQQQGVELALSKTEFLAQLSLLIGMDLDQGVALQTPQIASGPGSQTPIRPELLLFELQKSQVDLSTELLTKSKLPKISAFAQGGYGNPGLNMLDSSFDSFYMAGLRLNWNLFDWNRNRKQRQALQIDRELVGSQQEVFQLGIDLELVQLQGEIDKMEELIRYDHQIIPRYEKMVQTAESQLDNGLITASAYITEFTKLYGARSDLALHRTQKLLNQIQYQITEGTYEKSSN